MGNLVFIVETWGKCYDLFSQVDAKSPQVKTGGFFYGPANFDHALDGMKLGTGSRSWI